MSIIGPNTKKPNTAPIEKRGINVRATTASEDEHNENKNANAIITNSETALPENDVLNGSLPPTT